MLTLRDIAYKTAQGLAPHADRYTQIATIQQLLRTEGLRNLSTDRETIDSILDILYDVYGFKA